jgi:hypothetical protein
MKLGRILYIFAITVFIIGAAFFFYIDWVFAGFFASLFALGAMVRFTEVEQMRKIKYTAEARKKRREAYLAMSKKEQEEFLDNIEKELIENSVKLNR